MEALLERGFTLPGTELKFGLDVMLDLIPVVGDVIAAAMGAWIVWEARNLGMSKWHIARMSGNVGVRFPARADPLGRRDPRFLLPLEHPQPAGSSSAGSTSTIPGRG